MSKVISSQSRPLAAPKGGNQGTYAHLPFWKKDATPSHHERRAEGLGFQVRILASAPAGCSVFMIPAEVTLYRLNQNLTHNKG